MAKSGGKILFYRFGPNTTLICRPIGNGVEFFKFFPPEGDVKSVVVNKHDADTAERLLSEHIGRPVQPQHRFAINIIDRADGQVKVLEGGKSILNRFASWSKANACNGPGSSGGGDWQIKSTGEGKARRYEVDYLRATSVSGEEKAAIKESGQVADLETVFKGVALEDLLEKVYSVTPETASESTSNDAFGAVSDDGDMNF